MTSPVLDSSRASLQQRKILRCRAELHLDGGVMVLVRTIDVSPSGLSLMSQQSLGSGLSCRIVFQLPAGGRLHHIASSGKVVYNTCQGTQGFRLGVRFTDIDLARSKLIESLY